MTTHADIKNALSSGQVAEAGALIKTALSEGLDIAGFHVLYAHVLAMSAPWREVTALLPVGTHSLYTTGWLNSLATGRPVNQKGEPIPWITYPAIQFIETILRPEWNVFEWGSGNSTLWWAARVATVHAVEDNVNWQREVSKQMPANATVVAAPTEQEYLDALAAAPEPHYDVIVIDGSHRSACASVAMTKLAPGGIILFDNTDCQEHIPGVRHLRDQGLMRLDFWGLIPSYLYKNCTSVFLSDAQVLRGLDTPALQVSSVGLSCQQAIDAAAARAKGAQ